MNYILGCILIAVIIYGAWTCYKLAELIAKCESMDAEEKFYGVKYCQHCHAKLHLSVGPKRGWFNKSCPEGCETHSLQLLTK
jgi:hypothetical protein